MNTERNAFYDDFKVMHEIDRFLLRHWADALKREIRNIFYNYRISITHPNLIIEDVTSRWGRFDPLTKTVYITKRLIACYSWDSVVETLKHELAHYLVEDYYKVQEKPHGKTFKEACLKLGISSKARASDADMGSALDKRKNHETKENSVISKIKKLLALSGSLNEFEANEAVKKANQLILKHNLDLENSKHLNGYEYKIIGKSKKRIQSEELLILNILSEFFFVEYIIVPTYNSLKNEYFQSVEILGTFENIEICEYVYEFLKRECDELWKRHKKLYKVKGKREKKSYLFGLLEGFKTSLIPLKNDTSYGALIESKHNELIKYFKYRHPRVRKISKGGVKINPATYTHGHKDGKNVKIRNSIKTVGRIMGLIAGN